jgi:hypothetical protein
MIGRVEKVLGTIAAMITIAITTHKSQIDGQRRYRLIQDSIMYMAKKMLDAEQC